MAIAGFGFKWYDAFFLTMLVITVIIVAIHREKEHMCPYPLHLWAVVDYSTIFIFRLLMFVDNALASGMGLGLRDIGGQQRHARFCGRVVVLSILGLLLYPFLFAWTIIGTVWFSSAKSCLPSNGQKMVFVIWLIFSYCGLLGIILICIAKWFIRRHMHQMRAPQGNPISEIGVLIDLIRLPNSNFEAAGTDIGLQIYQQGHSLTHAQSEAVEAHIQQLPKIELKAVPDDCNECLICLEEFQIGNEVRGLPCAHHFHVECIDKWLRLNVRCPSCRCNVLPNLDLNAIIQAELQSTQRYLLRLQNLLRHDRSEHAGSGRDVDIA